MTTAIHQILSRLNEELSSLDVKLMDSMQTWADRQAAALQEYKNSDEFKTRHDASHKLFEIAGGKYWYGVLKDNDKSTIDHHVYSRCMDLVKLQNDLIESKLIEIGVKEVVTQTFSSTKDGFTGVFMVENDYCRKCFSVNVKFVEGKKTCPELKIKMKVW